MLQRSPEKQLDISVEQWRDMVHCGHVDKARASREYTNYYPGLIGAGLGSAQRQAPIIRNGAQ